MSRRVDTQMRRMFRLPRLGAGNLRSIHERDGGVCHLCRRHVPIADATRDHVDPAAAGGRDRAVNYRLAHRRCNLARGDLPLYLVRIALAPLDTADTLTPRSCELALSAALREWRAAARGEMSAT